MYKQNLTAQELASHIKKAEERNKLKAYQDLKHKCYGAISAMAANTEYSVTVELESKDLLGLEQVTEELRDLGYRFRFIEKGDSYELYISVEHCKEAL